MENGIANYNGLEITMINGYPSAEDIASVVGTATSIYSIDQESGKAVMIQNGDCLIIYTEAKLGKKPEIIYLLSTCN